jgi:hypothetical protein
VALILVTLTALKFLLRPEIALSSFLIEILKTVEFQGRLALAATDDYPAFCFPLSKKIGSSFILF